MSENEYSQSGDHDNSVAALHRHWQERRSSHVRAIFATDSIRFSEVTSPPSQPDLLPTLVMQTLIIPEGTIPEGKVIQSVTIPWRKILKLISQDPNIIYQIDPWKWEEIIAGSYKESGLFDEVILTPRSGDHGRDVIATKKGFCSIRCIESVKRFSPGRVVDANDVRALGFAVTADPNVSKGIVSTTWEFAPKIEEDPNIKSLIPHRLELVNRGSLIERFKSWNKGEQNEC